MTLSEGRGIRHASQVCHCYREKDDIIRIISARKATAKEQHIYMRNRK